MDSWQIFDDCIVLLSMLGPSTPARTQHSDLKSGRDDSQNQWHVFLDQLSLLCDYKPGGKTVASIAGEQITEGSKFWLATNASHYLKAKGHLKWILKELQDLVIDIRSNREDTQYRIFKESILFSHERVKNYSQRLCKLVQHSRELRRDDCTGKARA